MNNSCKNIIEKRKSVRVYLKKQVADKDVLEILDAARLAPSAKNKQPWRFYILSETEKDEVINSFL